MSGASTSETAMAMPSVTSPSSEEDEIFMGPLQPVELSSPYQRYARRRTEKYTPGWREMQRTSLGGLSLEGLKLRRRKRRLEQEASGSSEDEDDEIEFNHVRPFIKITRREDLDETFERSSAASQGEETAEDTAAASQTTLTAISASTAPPSPKRRRSAKQENARLLKQLEIPFNKSGEIQGKSALRKGKHVDLNGAEEILSEALRQATEAKGDGPDDQLALLTTYNTVRNVQTLKAEDAQSTPLVTKRKSSLRFRNCPEEEGEEDEDATSPVAGSSPHRPVVIVQSPRNVGMPLLKSILKRNHESELEVRRRQEDHAQEGLVQKPEGLAQRQTAVIDPALRELIVTTLKLK